MPLVPTIHLVYPHGDTIACPHAIGVRLAERLRTHHPVRLYDLTYPRPICPAPGDILIGHPDPAAWSVFQRSLAHPGWARRIGIAPFAHGDYRKSAFLHRIIPSCDLFLAITGTYWFESIATSAFAHCQAKLVHLDLAVEPRDFPFIKTTFNPPGRRRLVYIGHDDYYKNLPYLERIAALMPEVEIAWIGSTHSRFPHLRALGRHDFRAAASRDLLSGFDFLITVGSSDPNPTTILEAMSWGLIPLCSPQSGYHRESGVINLPLGDAAVAAGIVRAMLHRPEYELRAIQQHNLARLAAHYHWDRFAAVVRAAVDSPASPRLPPADWRNRLLLWKEELASPVAYWRYHHLRRALRRRLFARAPVHNCAQDDACAHRLLPH